MGMALKLGLMELSTAVITEAGRRKGEVYSSGVMVPNTRGSSQTTISKG